VDEDSGRAIYLRTTTGYTYEVGDEAAERHFTLRISDGDAGALTIGALSAETAGGRAQIVYTLSADATVDVEVLNIAGITVRRLVGERAQTAGPQQLTWDGRNNAGSAVPAGAYLVRITARSESGQQVSAVRSLQLGR
jgi:flagellar hook assembly protein FlgD